MSSRRNLGGRPRLAAGRRRRTADFRVSAETWAFLQSCKKAGMPKGRAVDAAIEMYRNSAEYAAKQHKENGTCGY